MNGLCALKPPCSSPSTNSPPSTSSEQPTPIEVLQRSLHRLRRRRPHIVFFDFDRTLTAVHVFKSLAGWHDSDISACAACWVATARPYALTERGQLRRLRALGPAWVAQVFGGLSRITAVKALLKFLKEESGIKLVLITRGYRGVARQCLADVGLLEFFDCVHGNLGSAYGDGTDFDEETQLLPVSEDERAFLEGPEDEWEAKWHIIFRYMRECNLSPDEAVLVDDDPEEVESVAHAVRTVRIDGGTGIDGKDVWELLGALELADAPGASKCRDMWCSVREPSAVKAPAIVLFNRKHLQVRVHRHLSMLEYEFKACKNDLRKVKMLLKSPLLLFSVAQHVFANQLRLIGKCDPTPQRIKQMVLAGMQSLGLVDKGDLSVMKTIPSASCLVDKSRNLSTDEMSVADTDGEDDGEQKVWCDADNALLDAGATHHLYQQPNHRASTRLSSKMFGSVVAMFQQALLGLCPITMATAGIRRNVVCCHNAGDQSPDLAVWSRYRKHAPLGSGHFGEVFLALEVCSGREVAVKQLERLEADPRAAALGEDAGQRANEADTLRALAHPNLLMVHEVIQCSDYVFIVTEVAPGGTVSAYLRKAGVGSWIAGAMQQVTSAVAYCHRLHVLHGDLKPENVLISGSRPDGSPLCLVCDFGHAMVCLGSTNVAAPGDPRYIPPEVVNEEGLSNKSDVYMLGVTAFELVTGGWLPFFRAKAVTLQMSYYQLKFGGVRDAIVSSRGLGWEDLELLRKSAPAKAQQVVRQMLSREAVDRPTALEVLNTEWLLSAAGPCKTAYDALLMSDAGCGWGLWAPMHPRFAERLRARAKLSWTCRMLIALIGSGLEPARVHGARLLFRRMDESGEGTLTKATFVMAMRQVGLAETDAQAIFAAGDLHDQHFMDFKNVVMLFLDLEEFAPEELTLQLKSVLSRIRGPCRGPSRWPLSRIQSEAEEEAAMEREEANFASEAEADSPPAGAPDSHGSFLCPDCQEHFANLEDVRAHLAQCHVAGTHEPQEAAQDRAVNDRGPAVGIEVFEAMLSQRPDARMERLLRDFRGLLGPTGELTAELLAHVLLTDPFSSERAAQTAM
mmetsp:Transcript_107342/g.308948  ORF Transcript_107342/g.308948 Transcript_107342/m.308948 type:complete len:1077 (-) Transcript_107342:53-3283(-)|eukprot:CAMPEP_0170212528 /NCGR_PEP_ID=MMETSP0116_2-20130129/5882_1 /TAXON_ID=400756 /ORGANISM="Durinskia baltica, Strain CSIRO CS-38" /LENGTH=1076 /DNA_ID=CAMNT_0010463067 /DNA_START=188 /DNA_END=3418 /DNA_ORIENTATION=+